MPALSEMAEAEFENIHRTLAQMPPGEALVGLSALELAGTAALLHNLYSAAENVLKQIVQASRPFPDTASWHRDLLAAAKNTSVISGALCTALQPYLAFRHLFVHGYAFNIDARRLRPLVDHSHDVFSLFEAEVRRHLGGPPAK